MQVTIVLLVVTSMLLLCSSTATTKTTIMTTTAEPNTSTTTVPAACSALSIPKGKFELIGSSQDSTSMWALTCSEGYMPIGGNIGVCSSAGVVLSVPTCVADIGCMGESTTQLHTTGGAVSTNCSASMTNGQTCAAMCSGNARVEGTIKCSSGRLVDASHCISESNATSLDVWKMFGSMRIEFVGSPTEASLAKGMAEAFSIDTQYLSILVKTLPESGEQFLSGRQGRPYHFLASNIIVEYEVVIPPNASLNTIASAVMALSEFTSTVGQVFVQSMSSSGMAVSRIVHTLRPMVLESVLVRNHNGTVVKPGTVPTPTPALEVDLGESPSISRSMIIGCVVGGVILLLLCGSAIHYHSLMQRKAEV